MRAQPGKTWGGLLESQGSSPRAPGSVLPPQPLRLLCLHLQYPLLAGCVLLRQVGGIPGTLGREGGRERTISSGLSVARAQNRIPSASPQATCMPLTCPSSLVSPDWPLH